MGATLTRNSKALPTTCLLLLPARRTGLLVMNDESISVGSLSHVHTRRAHQGAISLAYSCMHKQDFISSKDAPVCTPSFSCFCVPWMYQQSLSDCRQIQPATTGSAVLGNATAGCESTSWELQCIMELNDSSWQHLENPF